MRNKTKEIRVKNLLIEKLTYKGFGLAHKDGKTFFIYNGVPGDAVDIRSVHKKNKVIFGVIENYVRHADFKINPGCDVFGKCGACNWANLPYEYQLKAKNLIMKDFYKEKINPIIASPEIDFYRNKSFLPVSGTVSEPKIGMFAPLSHKVTEHKNCRLQPALFDDIAEEFKEYIKKSKASPYNETEQTGNLRHLGIRQASNGDILVILVTKSRKLPFSKILVDNLREKFPQITGIVQNINPSGGNRILGEKDKILFGSEYLSESLFEYKIKVHYQAFLQINYKQMLQMYDFTAKIIPKNSIVADAFSGSGTIGLSLAKHHKKIFCIEENKFAHLDAINNASLNKVENMFFINDLTENALPELTAKENPDAIIFDPPRKGVDGECLHKIAKHKIPLIVYISCDPSTQARDVKILKEYGYKIDLIQPFDMFPHTYHTENIVLLKKDVD